MIMKQERTKLLMDSQFGSGNVETILEDNCLQ